MKKVFNKMLKAISSRMVYFIAGLSFSAIVIAVNAAMPPISTPTAALNSPLTSANWNLMKQDLENLKTETDNLNAAIASNSSVVTERTASAVVWRWPTATANCLSNEIVVGGGGSCTDTDGQGFNFINSTLKQGNGWLVSCDTPVKHNVTAFASALCMKKW